MSEDMSQQNQSRFNFNSHYTLRAVNDNRTCTVNGFNGNVSLSIWDQNNRQGPVDTIPMNRELTHLMIKTLKELLKAQPNTTLTLEQKVYQRNEDGKGGKWVPGTIFKFVKDDKQMCFMDIHTKKLGTPLKLIYRSGNFSVGTDELSDHEKSALSLSTFISYLENEVPQLRVAGCFNKRAFSQSNRPANRPPSAQASSFTNDDEAPY